MIATLGTWSAGLAPDITATIKRFPYVTLMLILTTLAALLIVNEMVVTEDTGGWARLLVGLASGALLASGCALHVESNRPSKMLARVITLVPPVVVVALFQVTDTRFVLPWVLPVVVVLLVSLSASFGRTTDSARQQAAFWKSNARAIPSAVFALVVGLVIGLALFATSWSLETLFTVEVGWLLERWFYPVLALLMIPLYWLSTLPRPGEQVEGLPAAELVGQFVLIPFTLVYALILHAYAVQIVVVGSLPDGVVGQMVFYFMLTGLVTWIVVHPSMETRSSLVRVFRIAWFALTIVPLVLFAIALWERIEAYGLTPIRVIFIGFGVWASALTFVFLLTRGRADIRWIPGLAALSLLALSIGPQNIENLPRWQQTLRLQALVSAAYTPDGFVWEADARRAASAAFDYLAFEAGERNGVADIMRAALDEEAIPDGISVEALRTRVGFDSLLPGSGDERGIIQRLHLREERQLSMAVDVRAYPYFYGVVTIAPRTEPLVDAVFDMWSEGEEIAVARNGAEVGRGSARDWIERQAGNQISDPLLVIADGETAIYIQTLAYTVTLQGDEEVIEIQSAYGYAFSMAPAL